MLEVHRKNVINNLPFFNFDSKQVNLDINSLNSARINYNSYDTALEPYIGWEIVVTKITQRYIYYINDLGHKLQEQRREREYFTI